MGPSDGTKTDYMNFMRFITVFMALSLSLPYSMAVAKPHRFGDRLKHAENAYEQLDLQKAEKLYQTLLADVPPELLSSTPIRFWAHVGLALIAHAEGKVDKAKEYLNEAITLGGWQILSSEKYPPSFIALFEGLKTGKVTVTGSIAITTDPPFAKLLLRGFSIGESPITIDNLQPGKYKVKATLKGYKDSETTIEITSSDKKVASLALSIPQKKVVSKKNLISKKKGILIPRIPSIDPVEKAFVLKSTPVRSKKHPWYENSILWTGALVLGGGLAVYYISKKPTDSGTVTLFLP